MIEIPLSIRPTDLKLIKKMLMKNWWKFPQAQYCRLFDFCTNTKKILKHEGKDHIHIMMEDDDFEL
jgi:hypothetical protein